MRFFLGMFIGFICGVFYGVYSAVEAAEPGGLVKLMGLLKALIEKL